MFSSTRLRGLGLGLAGSLLGTIATIAAQSSAHGATCTAGFKYAAFGKNSIKFSGGSSTSSYQSTPVYVAPAAFGGNIGTNAASASISGASTTINGAIDLSMGMVLDMPIAPSPLPPAGTKTAVTSKIFNFTPGSFGDESSKPTDTWNMAGGTYVFKSLYLKGNFNVMGPVTIYITALGTSPETCLSMDATNNINVAGKVASNLVIYVTGPTCKDITVNGGSNASYAVYAPSALITVNGNSDIYGSIVGKDILANGGAKIIYDRSLASYGGAGPSCPVPVVPPSLLTEVARSGPVTTEIGTPSSGTQTAQMLGTYGVYNPPYATPPSYTSGAVGTYTFPTFYGHMRAYNAGSLTSSGTTYSTAAAYWDANAYLEGLSSDSRTIFTNTTTGTNPTKVTVTTSNASVLFSLLGVAVGDAPTLIGAVRRGWTIAGSPRARLGGVDRSTPAVVEASPQTSTNRDRPKMVYFGALDGMLHAVCGETNAAYGCSAPGKELWAFVPRTQLGRLRTNRARVDGSPKVSDVFDNFGGSTTKSMHTVLTFQTAVGTSGNDAPTAYGLDITDPSAPVLLWERVLQGPGLGTAMGPVRIGAATRHLTFIAASVASGVGALQLTALDSRTGVQVWQRTFDNTLGAPMTAIPGGVAAVDVNGDSDITDVVATNVDGKIYRVAAATGATPTGIAQPLVSFQDANHPIGAPPSIWKDAAGVLHALAPTGGYVDTTMLTTVWAPLGRNQFVVSVPITRATTMVLNGSSTTAPSASNISGGTPDFALSYGTTTRAYSQITIAGGTFFLVADTDIEPNSSQYGLVANTGRVTSGRLSTGVMGAARTTGGGKGAVDVVGGIAYTGGGNTGVEAESGLDSGDPTTAGTELTFDIKAVRQLWLRIQ